MNLKEAEILVGISIISTVIALYFFGGALVDWYMVDQYPEINIENISWLPTGELFILSGRVIDQDQEKLHLADETGTLDMVPDSLYNCKKTLINKNITVAVYIKLERSKTTDYWARLGILQPNVRRVITGC